MRILGNELPPRDTVGSRVEQLRYILEKEPALPGCKKLWVINRVVDKELLESYLTALWDAHHDYTVIPFDKYEYRAAQDRNEKLHAAIGINSARNRAITYGHEWSDWALIVDGDCMFTYQGWKMFTAFVVRDQQECPQRQYYTVPSSRCKLQDDRIVALCDRAEAQPMFRRDSKLRFDEDLVFGQSDKQMLLRQLGHNILGYDNQAKVSEGSLCASYGFICHLATGDDRTELDVNHRVMLRRKSLEMLLEKLDNVCEQRTHAESSSVAST